MSTSPQWMMEKNSCTEVRSHSLPVIKMRNWKKAINFPLFLPPEKELKSFTVYIETYASLEFLCVCMYVCMWRHLKKAKNDLNGCGRCKNSHLQFSE